MRTFLLSMMLVFFWVGGLKAGFIYEDFPLVQDGRNFKEGKGGKGFGPQGRLLPEGTQSFLYNESLLDQTTTAPWHYVVSLNCSRSQKNIVDLLEQLASALIPATEKKRLGIILGINERLTVDSPLTYQLTGKALNLDADRLNNLGVPLLVVYSQWTSFRESVADKSLSPQAIRQVIHERVLALPNERQREAALKRLRAEDSTHKFPFGTMRQHTLNVPSAVSFLQRMEGKAGRTPVYVHIQDADFVDLQTPLLFGSSFSKGDVKVEGEEKGAAALKKEEEPYLFRHYDQLISFHRDTKGVLPVVVGGAHVYSPQEDVKGASVAAKYWTRFGSEMGNRVKHLSARYGPYGVYFHEPNTLILSPTSLALAPTPNTQLPGWGLFQSRFTKFSFGIDSELQEFTRTVFDNMPQPTCQELMIFSSTAVLATSMKRGGTQRDFLLSFNGTYRGEERRFSAWQIDDLMALHGMPQEVMHPNKWASMMCTSFAQHRKKDSRSVMAELFNLFDPYHAASFSPPSFYRALVKGEYLIDNRPRLKTLFEHFRSAYDLLHQGDLMAFYIFSAAWEAGQAMRLMYLDHLECPLGLTIKVPHLEEERTFLGRQLAYERTGQYAALPNPFIIQILELDKVPVALSPRTLVERLAKLLYDHHKVKKEAARLMGTSPGTLNKLLEQKEVAMRTILKLASPVKQLTAPGLVERYGLPLEKAQNLTVTV